MERRPPDWDQIRPAKPRDTERGGSSAPQHQQVRDKGRLSTVPAGGSPRVRGSPVARDIWAAARKRLCENEALPGNEPEPGEEYSRASATRGPRVSTPAPSYSEMHLSGGARPGRRSLGEPVTERVGRAPGNTEGPFA